MQCANGQFLCVLHFLLAVAYSMLFLLVWWINVCVNTEQCPRVGLIRLIYNVFVFLIVMDISALHIENCFCMMLIDTCRYTHKPHLTTDLLFSWVNLLNYTCRCCYVSCSSSNSKWRWPATTCCWLDVKPSKCRSSVPTFSYRRVRMCDC